MGYNVNPLVYHAVHPAWTAGELLWYRDTGADGVRFVLFDPAKRTKEPAFDQAKLAAALSAAAGRKYEANKLPFNAIELSADGGSVLFSAGGRRFRCDRQGSQCAVEQGSAAAGGRGRGGNAVRHAGRGQGRRHAPHLPRADVADPAADRGGGRRAVGTARRHPRRRGRRTGRPPARCLPVAPSRHTALTRARSSPRGRSRRSRRSRPGRSAAGAAARRWIAWPRPTPGG